MSRNNTGNPIGSGDPRDREDNSKNFDEAVNSSANTWTDRFGVPRKTMSRQEALFDSAQSSRESQFVASQADKQARFNAFIAASGYTGTGTGGAIQDYAAGITITEYNQIIRDSFGEFWRLSGATELPYTTTGAGLPEGGALVSVGDAALRQELASNTGSELVKFLQAGAGAVARDLQDRGRDWVSVKDFGAVGDGVTDDTTAIQAAITAAAGKKLAWPTATYKFTAPLSISNIDVDFQGSSLFYAGPTGAFALSLNSNAGTGTAQTAGNVFENFTLYQSDFTAYTTVSASTTWDPPSVAAGAAITAITPAGVSTTVSVPGATIGGYARATLSTLTEGLALTAWVSAPDTVTVWLSNYTANAVDLGSGALDVTVVNNAYHGLSIGGPLGSLRNAKVWGFTGVSFGVGGPTGAGSNNGRDPVSGVMFGAGSRAYYWDVEVNVAAAAGWAGVILPRSNENVFKFGTFPLDAYGDAVPKRAPTINQLIISGIGNKFQRTSLESNSSEETLVIGYGSNQCDLTQGVYIETNGNYATSPYPRVFARGTTSGNRLTLRHPYGGASAIKDLGFANYLIAPPSFYVNGAQIGQPAKGRNLVVNGDFENGLTGWSDFSSGGFVTTVTGTGRVSGKRVRVDLTAGRIGLTQDLLTANGLSAGALSGCNVTVCGWIKTNVDNVQLRVSGTTNAQVEGDEVERFFVCTMNVGASCVISISNQANRTGYVEFSNITAYVGNEPGMVAERTQPIGSATYNPPSLNSGTQTTTTVTVTGAALGDFVLPSFSLDLQGINITAYVSAADTVTCVLRNDTGGTIDLPPGILRCRVIKV